MKMSSSWTKPRTEKQERLFQQWKLDVQNVLVASKTGVDTRRLEADLEENVGKCPVEEMGFAKWGEFLYAIREIFIIGHFQHEDPHNPRTRLFLFINQSHFMMNANEDVAEIAKLVRGQEKSKTKKRMDGTTNAPMLRELRLCNAAYLLGKTSTTESRMAFAASNPRQYGKPSRGRGGGNRGGKSSSSGRSSSYNRPSTSTASYGGYGNSVGFSGGSSNYNSQGPKLLKQKFSPPRRGPSGRINILPSGFDDDGDSDIDDMFDYCSGGVSKLPSKSARDDEEWSYRVPTRPIDVVDNRRPIQQPVATNAAGRPTFMFPAAVNKPNPTIPPLIPTLPPNKATAAASSTTRRPTFQFPAAINKSNPNTSIPPLIPTTPNLPPMFPAAINKSNPTTIPPLIPTLPPKAATAPSASSTTRPTFQTPAPVKPEPQPTTLPSAAKSSSSSKSDDSRGVLRVNLDTPSASDKIMIERGPLGRGSPLRLNGLRRPDEGMQSIVERWLNKPSSSTSDTPNHDKVRRVDLETLERRPVVEVPDTYYEDLDRATTTTTTSTRMPQVVPPTTLKPRPKFETPERINKSIPLLPTPISSPRPPVPILNGLALKKAVADVLSMTMKPRTGPPNPMKPYTPPSSHSSTPSSSSSSLNNNNNNNKDQDKGVLRVTVEPKGAEEPVMLHRGPSARGRGRPLCRNGSRRPSPTFYEDGGDCVEIDNDLFDRIVKIRGPVEQVRRLQFAEL